MAEEATTTAAETAVTVQAPAAQANTAWYAEITDPELRGYVENRGLATKTPLEAFLETAKAHRAAEAHLGVPADRLLRLPADQNPDAWREVWGRLGAPDKPEGYDLSGVKRADGTDLDPEFAAALRNTAAANHVTKEAAAKIAADLTKYQEAQAAEQAAASARAEEAARAALKTSWGANYDANLDIARRAARSLGATQEQVDALEKAVGFDKVMGFLLNAGEKMGEATYIEGGPPGGPNLPRTKEGALERINALKNDTDWLARWNNGGSAEAAELNALMRQANPEVYAAAGV